MGDHVPLIEVPKEITPYIITLVVILYVILVLVYYTNTLLNVTLSIVSVYDSSLVMILSQVFTRHRILHICHWVSVAYLTLSYYFLNVGGTFLLVPAAIFDPT